MPNFRLLISPNLYLDRVVLLKAYKISAKNVQRSCVSWHWRLMQNVKKNSCVVLKLTRICYIFIRALKSLKYLHFDWSLAWEVRNVWSKKAQRSTIESDAKFKEKLTCGLENNMRNLENLHQSAWKFGLKIGTFMGYFYPK